MPVVTRLATEGDYAAFATLFPELAVTDPLPTPEYFREQMLPRVVLALEAEVPVGYAFFLTYGPTAHLGHLVVAPARRGARIGEALIDDVRARARAEGCERMYLNVRKANLPALRLYTRCGFVQTSSSWVVRMAWSTVPALPDMDSALSFVPTEVDDLAVASRFDLDAPRMALLRARPGTSLVALREGDAIVAVAAYDRGFPGAYPFRAVRPSLAGALLRAIAPLAESRLDFLNVAVERDEALARALLDAGAELTWELLRMDVAL